MTAPKTGIRHKVQGVRQDASLMRPVPWVLRQQLITHHSSAPDKGCYSVTYTRT
jgi:hypothetical protein